MMPTIPAEWPMYMEMIQKLPMFVSHIYIVVMHLTAVSSYMYQHDILIGFLEFNQGFTVSLPGYKNSLVSLHDYNVHVIR